MKIDINIVNAIDQYMLANKISANAFAEVLGISPATMVKWRRQGNGITGRRWQELYKHIKSYLPQDRIFVASNGEEHYSSLNEGTGGKAYFEPKYVPQMAPVFTQEDLRRYNSMVESVEQYACVNNLQRREYRQHIAGFGSIFCYDLPQAIVGVPAGARLYASENTKPRNGGLVLAVTSTGQILLGIYTVKGGSFTISCGVEKTTGKLAEARGMFTMICPVVMYEVFTY